MPELPRHARGALLDARPRPPAERDAARRGDHRRLAERGGEGGARTGASPARAAAATARPIPTWRATRPSSSRTTTSGARGRCRRTRWAASASGRRSRPGCPRSSTGCAGSALFSGALKRIAGIAPQRRLPRFAPRSFRAQFDAGHRAQRDPGRSPGGVRRGDPVLLFPDTFTNHFRPQTGLAATRVLRSRRRARRIAEGAPVLRPAVLRLRHARRGESAACRKSSTRSRRDRVRRPDRGARAGLPLGVQGRAAASSSPATPARRIWPRKRYRSPNTCGRRTGSRPRSAAARCCTATATRRRWAARKQTSRCSKPPASRPRRPRPAAAAWPARSASGPRPTKPR